MNLTRALDVALPEIPVRVIAMRPPLLHPNLVFKEQVLGGEAMVRALVPGGDCVFNFTPQNWQVIRLCDGKRSYEEIAEEYARETGQRISVEDVRGLAEELEAADFWYKTEQEKNILLMQKSAEERRQLLRHKKRKWGDLGMITFPAFNPDRFLTWLHERIRFMFTGWFTLLTLAAFGFMIGIYATHWSLFLRDTFQFYTFTDKNGWDVAVFWGLTLILSAIHETAHGVACKHYAGKVSSMGFALVYLAPAFYTDTTEGMILGNTFQRIMITVAGVWSEMIVCAIATPLWWGTAPGTAIHELAYTIILITGVGVILINWNPLIKLDGYHIVCDLFGIVDLKENSTAYASAWVKKNIWKLPVEVPFVPQRRRMPFFLYAIVSGLYSYTVLFVLARFVGNVFRNFNPEWSFLPELATALLIFRSRLRTLYTFMKFVYLDKKDRVRAWFTPRNSGAVAAAALLLLFVPVWRDSIDGRFTLEPQNRAVLRAMVPGMVEAVFVEEGQPVAAGAVVTRLRNLPLQSRLAHSQADYATAQAQYNASLARLAATGNAEGERHRLGQQSRQLALETAGLELKSPIAGVVMTPRPGNRIASYVTAGTELVEIADLTALRARIFVSEYDMYRYRGNGSARISVDGIFGKRAARLAAVAPVSSEIEPGLIDLTKYKGLAPPKFYAMDLIVDNTDGRLRPGMRGTGRVYGTRRSLAGFTGEAVGNFLGRKLW